MSFPVATRPLEYVAFFNFEVRVQSEPAYVFIAIDAFDAFAFNLGAAMNEDATTVKGCIYALTEDPEFKHRNQGVGFTIILDKFGDLIPELTPIIHTLGGKIRVDSVYNKYLAIPLLQAFANIK